MCKSTLTKPGIVCPLYHQTQRLNCLANLKSFLFVFYVKLLFVFGAIRNNIMPLCQVDTHLPILRFTRGMQIFSIFRCLEPPADHSVCSVSIYCDSVYLFTY